MRAALVATKAVARGIECSGSRALCSNSQGVAGRSLVSGSGGNGGVRRSRWESTRHLCGSAPSPSVKKGKIVLNGSVTRFWGVQCGQQHSRDLAL
ncbi:hypothetical protein NGA_0607700 [Nannochloropsis gaditana CCMP526]|uniref:uncharacterized protein n=1 Tax=Nannochloropsis gaditana (strain CCMP526) TaxID=1093141 RepID=UPI00029F4EB6|nr:hypothetical protein NGA_0607700 [Nannochloropsis gaditana CCMP526]EKU20789.1 hypothetical protein NGA_0607700 [Nannochloropsis gaditana CCMP526]|eukprot:XP_005855574.1 hypothetical protein NGA_0607700 [Nannochloropsis gaditana CCMP526]